MKTILYFFLLASSICLAQEVALLKYSGGGDWYANPTSLPNLIQFCNQNIKTTLNSKPATVSAESSDIFSYPFIHMTGHGNVVFAPNEIINLRNYLLAGGFLHISTTIFFESSPDHRFHLNKVIISIIAFALAISFEMLS